MNVILRILLIMLLTPIALIVFVGVTPEKFSSNVIYYGGIGLFIAIPVSFVVNAVWVIGMAVRDALYVPPYEREPQKPEPPLQWGDPKLSSTVYARPAVSRYRVKG